MTNKEMEELSEIVVAIEEYDDQIEPMYRLYTTIKKMIKRKKPELLDSNAKQHSTFDDNN